LQPTAELDVSLPRLTLAPSRVRIDCRIARPSAGLPQRPCRLVQQSSLFLLFLQEIISGH
jgi:hypothetical protein